MKYLILCSGLCLILTSCQSNLISINDREITGSLASENRKSHLFNFEPGFKVSNATEEQIIEKLKKERSSGIENVSFTIISNKHPNPKEQELLAKQISSCLRKAGFIESRIIDSGCCYYKEANNNIRIDALSYDLKPLDMEKWRTSIGDCDIEKDLPKKGYAAAWNLEQMVANKADLISPRKYKGQEVEAAIKALSTDLSSQSSSDSSSSSTSSSSSSSSFGSSTSMGSSSSSSSN